MVFYVSTTNVTWGVVVGNTIGATGGIQGLDPDMPRRRMVKLCLFNMNLL